MASNEYADLIKSPFWQKRRLEIMKRDNFVCQFCGDHETTLNVHHIIYIPGNKPWDYKDEHLITLCEPCHLDEEKLKDEDKFIVAQIVQAGINRRSVFALAVELRRYLSDHTIRHEKFLRLTEWLHGN